MGNTPKKKKRPHDLNKLAASIISEIAGENRSQETIAAKNPAAVALGRLGGLKGGEARAKKLTAQQRTDIARKAAKVRWHQRKEEK